MGGLEIGRNALLKPRATKHWAERLAWASFSRNVRATRLFTERTGREPVPTVGWPIGEATSCLVSKAVVFSGVRRMI